MSNDLFNGLKKIQEIEQEVFKSISETKNRFEQEIEKYENELKNSLTLFENEKKSELNNIKSTCEKKYSTAYQAELEKLKRYNEKIKDIDVKLIKEILIPYVEKVLD